MAITFVAQGAVSGGGASPIAMPAGTANNDLILTPVVNKPDTVSPATPTNWTLDATVAGGGGTTGNQVGPTRGTVFHRVLDAGWSTGPIIDVVGGNSTACRTMAFRGAAGVTYDIAATTGVFGTAATVTNCASTLDSDPGIQAGDLLFVLYSNMDDGPTWSAESVTVPGCTVGAATELAEAIESTVGNDVGGMVFTAPVTAGASTGVPSTGATASIATRGTVTLVRIREVAPAAIDLTVANAAHAQSSESVALVVDMAPAAATQAQTAESPTLTQVHSLTVQDATHGHTAAAPTLTQQHELAAQSATHVQTSETPTLQVVLGAQNATHAVTSDTPTLTQTHALTVQDATHGHSAAAVALVVDLAVQGATHGHTATSPSLAQSHALLVDAATHGQAAENATLSTAASLSVSSATQTHAADNVTLTQVHALVVQDAAQDHVTATPSLTQSHALTVDDASHEQNVEALDLTQVHILAVDDAGHGQAADDVTLTLGTPITYPESTPPDRVLTVSAEARTLVVAAEDRRVAIEADDRTLVVPANDRTDRVPAESRALAPTGV